MADAGKGRSWPVQLAIAAVPALITSYFSYQIAMEARTRSNASYDTTATALRLIEESLRVFRSDLMALRTHLDELERQVSQGNVQPGSLPRLEFRAVEPALRVPASLDSAVQQYLAKRNPANP